MAAGAIIALVVRSAKQSGSEGLKVENMYEDSGKSFNHLHVHLSMLATGNGFLKFKGIARSDLFQTHCHQKMYRERNALQYSGRRALQRNRLGS